MKLWAKDIHRPADKQEKSAKSTFFSQFLYVAHFKPTLQIVGLTLRVRIHHVERDAY